MLPAEVLEPIMRELGTLNDEMRAAGVWVLGAGLAARSTATMVRHHDGETLLTDGPFSEGKEHIGGISIIDVADLDAALSWAGRLAAVIGLWIEVRPFDLHLLPPRATDVAEREFLQRRRSLGQESPGPLQPPAGSARPR